ncbi:MAG: hypothetical protein ABSH08_20745 [Tepidisphaeraceae bacterium]
MTGFGIVIELNAGHFCSGCTFSEGAAKVSGERSFRLAKPIISLAWSVGVVSVMLATPARAKQFFDHAESLVACTNITEKYAISIERPGTEFEVRGSIRLSSGLIYVRVLDASGAVKTSFSAQGFEGRGTAVKLDPGNYTVEIRAENAVGNWHLEGDDSSIELRPAQFAGGALMILVGLGAAAMAKWVWRIQWRWLWCGALLWAIAVAVKFLIAIPLNGPLLGALQKHLPKPLYLTLGSSYIGLLTGVTEVAITLAAGMVWRRLASDVRRAVGIGLGAGAIEAVLLGLSVMAGNVAMAAQGMSLPTVTATTILAPTLERIMVIPCHAVVRAMALFTVASGRWWWFWGGFAFFSAIDGLAGFYYLMNWVNTVNPWLLELPLIVFPIISIPLLRYLWRHWATATTD